MTPEVRSAPSGRCGKTSIGENMPNGHNATPWKSIQTAMRLPRAGAIPYDTGRIETSR